jgi:hypothetical protein
MNYQNKIIFLIGRDNWQKDDALNHVLINYLKKSRHEIRWEDPAGSILFKFRSFENNLKWLPNYVKKINLRIVQIFYGIFNWNYFNYLSYRRNSSVELRNQKLKERIVKLGNNNEIIILSRSVWWAICISYCR